MLNLTQLLKKTLRKGEHTRRTDQLRYGDATQGRGFAPVIVWNITNRCNLECVHCYGSSSRAMQEQGLEIETLEKIAVQLAEFKITYLVLSGGDPLLLPEFDRLAGRIQELEIPYSVSVNGTLITQEVARKLKRLGVTYVGVSLDGLGEVNDKIRRKKGAFDMALKGALYARDQGIKVGLRMTLMPETVDEVPKIIELGLKHGFDRVYFSHLVFAGRGQQMLGSQLEKNRTRAMVEGLIKTAMELEAEGSPMEIVTGSNDCDGALLYLYLKEHDPANADGLWQKLKKRGGNTTGEKIFNIDHQAIVYPDQFWREQQMGDLKSQSLADILDPDQTPLLRQLVTRETRLIGRCSQCAYLEICRGSNRARAEFVTQNPWGSDPACYLTDEEISL